LTQASDKAAAIQGLPQEEEALNRLILNDEQWERVAPLLPGKVGDPGRSAADNRMFLEGVLWVARVGAPWRDLPAAFGNWNSVFQRFRRWALKGVFERVFRALSGDPDFEYALIDGTIIRVHQHGTGAKGGLKIRRSGVRAAA
jgi:transposase